MFENVPLLFPIIYVVLNVFSFVLYGTDKLKAKTEKRRISEQNLLIAAFFGPIGAWIGMQFFRHKIRKPIFTFLIPLVIGVHILLILWTRA
jgi:uncharacterized membrane protein YsdA (DUF1294 family)